MIGDDVGKINGNCSVLVETFAEGVMEIVIFLFALPPQESYAIISMLNVPADGVPCNKPVSELIEKE